MAEAQTDTATETPERGAQNVSVVDCGPARKKITIEVPAERIAARFETQYKELRGEAQVPGFRRGRAPQRLLEKRFGEAVRDDVKARLITECYTQAIEEQKLEVIGQPEVKNATEIKLPETGPLTFEVEVEVQPKVELPSLEGLEVQRVKFQVTPQEIDEQVEVLQRRFGKVDTISSGAVMEDDYAMVDVKIFEGRDANDEAPVLHEQPAAYIIVHGEEMQYKGHVLGILVEDLGKQMLGKNVGDTVTISTTGPVGHENDKIRGREITLRLKITALQRLTPAAPQDLPAQTGVESLEKLREQLQAMLTERHERQQKADMHKQLAEQLAKAVKMDLPEGLSGRQAERNLRRMALELTYRGEEQDKIEQQIAEARAGSQAEAQKQLKQFFILEAAAKQLEVEVGAAEVNGRIAMIAMQQNRRPEKLRQDMQRSGEIENLYLQLREQKTLDKILEKAKITEVEPPTSEQSGNKKRKTAQ